MADKGRPIKKADIILKYGRSNFRKLNTLLAQQEKIDSIEQDIPRLAVQNEVIQKSLADEIRALKRELKYLAMQNESIYSSIAERVEKLAPTPDAQPSDARPLEIDYDLLADKVAARMPVPQTVEGETAYVAPTREVQLDYDLLADKVAARMPVPQVVEGGSETYVAPVRTDIDYDRLAYKISSYLPDGRNTDADYLADKVVSRIPLQESVSPDYIASKVAEQLMSPKQSGEVDYELLSQKVAEKIGVAPQSVQSLDGTVDYDYLADKLAQKIKVDSTVADSDCDYIAQKVAEKVVIPEVHDLDYDYLAQKLSEKVVIPESRSQFVAAPVMANGYDVNEEELADAIALKVGSLKPEDFEILVDDEGCRSISKEITEKLDYEAISAAVAEKLRSALDIAAENQPDYEEMAARISEKITVAGVNEDAIADKAAAVLSNYLPEFDGDDIADKVAEQVISAMPSVINQDAMSDSISQKLIESQQDNDYEIVLDDDGIVRMSDSVSEKIHTNTEERFNNIDREIAEIKALLESGVKLNDEIAITNVAYTRTVQPEEREEPLVRVSDVVYEEVEEVEEPQQEEQVSKIVEIPVEPKREEVAPVENKSEKKITPVVVPIVKTVDEDGEEYDGEDLAGGVDFVNMMRYDRSFIARIIQSTDEQKAFYGAVRSALLSYRRVNSNIAWGAERFHKGRETIARFKIRGKTLVLYLALDPATHEYSVYHHKDVSDNKSLSGTPMMIKIMSPRGVKKAIRLIDEMLEARDGVKFKVPERDYAAMYPYETITELIEDGLVKDVKKNKDN